MVANDLATPGSRSAAARRVTALKASRAGSQFDAGAKAGPVPDAEHGRRDILVDALLAATTTAVALIGVVRVDATPREAALALACAGPLSLFWRRSAPMVVLLISAASLCTSEALSYPHTAVPFAMLIALYTLATTRSALVTAAASAVALVGAVTPKMVHTGWLPGEFDDQLVAYLLSIGAACVLGYGVQLTRARNELLHQQAVRLETEHAAHEEQILQQQRNRIARDLHDVVAHQVSVITALAAGADRVCESQPDKARQALNSIETAGREALTEMRRLLQVLRPDAHSDARPPQTGLDQIPALVDQTAAAGLPVALSVHGEHRRLPAGVEQCAYRIVQEALTNTMKHAGPARASVQLTYTPTALELEVCDTGNGLSRHRGVGHGLIGMQERAALVGGRLGVGRAPNGGVRVHAVLPTNGHQ